MIPQTRDIFLVVVHYGPHQPTELLLRSAVTGSILPKKIVVVDNGGGPRQFSTSNPLVKVVYPKENGGYAAGITTGLGVFISEGVATDDIVVCMNNDVQLADNTLEVILNNWRSLEEQSVIGAAAGCVNLFTGRAQINNRYGAKLDRGGQAFYQLPYLDGCLFASSFGLLLKHRLPEEYFMYWEDVAFSRYLTLQGVKLKALPELAVGHSWSKGECLCDKDYYLIRNGAMFLQSHSPWPWRPYWKVINRVRYLYHLLSGHEHVYSSLRDAIANVKGKQAA